MGDARGQATHDVAVGDEIPSVHRVHVCELQPPGLRLAVQLSQHSNLDRASLREHFVGVQQKFLSAAEVENSNAQHPIEALIDLSNTGFEFLPQHLLLGQGCV